MLSLNQLCPDHSHFPALEHDYLCSFWDFIDSFWNFPVFQLPIVVDFGLGFVTLHQKALYWATWISFFIACATLNLSSRVAPWKTLSGNIVSIFLSLIPHLPSSVKYKQSCDRLGMYMCVAFWHKNHQINVFYFPDHNCRLQLKKKCALCKERKASYSS